MRVLVFACIALSACASPRWLNPQNPGADLEADMAACARDAERVGRLNQLGSQAVSRNCIDGPMCLSLAENQRIQTVAEGANAQKRCMAARGWRPVG